MSATAIQVDYFRLIWLCILEDPGAKVLLFALKHGTNNTSQIHLDQYLNAFPKGSKDCNYSQLPDKKRKIKEQFDKSQIDKIQKDSSWETFDITLLYQSIRLACKNVAELQEPHGSEWKNRTKMEGLLNQIKEERNTCVHERPHMTEHEFNAKVDELRKLFFDALEAVKVRYSVLDQEITDKKDEIESEIRDIKETFTDKKILKMSFDKQLALFKEESKRHLKDIYQNNFQYIDPLCFLSGSAQTRLPIQTIFSKVVLKNNTEGGRKEIEIDCWDLLKLTQSSATPSQPQLIMVSGVAGSGKTTLLTFILSEWLKDQQDRRIHHLDQYDIVLRVLCRETEGKSLEEFLQQCVPSILIPSFKDLLVTFLKECKVLFLIDGLDERNSSSKQLVNDILNVGKYVSQFTSQFTIMSTSRPEHVEDFLAKTRQSYQQLETEMVGIRDSERTDFVLKHYDHLPSDQPKGHDKLRNLMDDIGRQDHFGLPLNLLFLATLFNDDPECIKHSTTQSRLYETIHLWCIDKLHHRLAGKQQSSSRIARKKKIKTVLKVMYRVELEGLLEDRLYLCDEDIDQVMECCKTQELDSDELLSAFFTLRKSITNRRVQEKYYAPHKSLQEFYAAMHILTYLEETSRELQGAVRRVLQDVMKVESLDQKSRRKVESLDLKSKMKEQVRKNIVVVLRHLVSLLSYRENSPDVTPLAMAIQEVVDLLVEYGMTGCEGWLEMLAETEINQTVQDQIVHHVTSKSIPFNRVTVRDSTVVSAVALLPHVPPADVTIELDRPLGNITNVKDFCAALEGHFCTSLRLHHDYQHPDTPPASDLLLHNLPVRNLGWFEGHLSADAVLKLPQSLTNLYLAVSDDQQASTLLPALHLAVSGDQHTLPSLPNLSYLNLHVHLTAAVTPSAFTTPLPDFTAAAAADDDDDDDDDSDDDDDDDDDSDDDEEEADGDSNWDVTMFLKLLDTCNVHLKLTGLEGNLMDLACQVVSALQPKEWGNGMEAPAWRDLLERLTAARIRVRGVSIPDTNNITDEEMDDLTTLARNRLGCELYRLDSYNLWWMF